MLQNLEKELNKEGKEPFKLIPEYGRGTGRIIRIFVVYKEEKDGEEKE